jgi:hypothetical protein
LAHRIALSLNLNRLINVLEKYGDRFKAVMIPLPSTHQGFLEAVTPIRVRCKESPLGQALWERFAISLRERSAIALLIFKQLIRLTNEPRPWHGKSRSDPPQPA